MNKKGKIALISAVILVICVSTLLISSVEARSWRGWWTRACNDGIDNDGDSYIDYPNDPGCRRWWDWTETNINIECDDGSDNDGDSAIDYNDGGCSGPTDDDETNCGDGVCEGGETSGSCPADCGTPDSCSDTDGGNYIFTFGTTSGYLNATPYSNDDYCTDTSNIMEYYCSGDYEQSQQQSCGTDFYGPNYCSGDNVYKNYTDYSCATGECDVDITPEFVETCSSPYECVNGACVIPDSCSETDGGWVPPIQGSVYGYYLGNYYNYTDYCIDSTFLYEYECYGDQKSGGSQVCIGNGTTMCSNGACV